MKNLNPQIASNSMCLKHASPIHYINIFDTSKPFICIRCAKEKGIKLEGLLHFSELLNENDFDFLIDYPPLEKSVTQRMSQIQNLSNKNEGILQNIEEYFSKLQVEIEKQIYQAKSKAKEKAIKFLQSNEEIFNKYNEISFRKQLRQILNDGGEDMESKVSEILGKVVKEEHNKINSKILGEHLDANKILRESVSFAIPKKIENIVLNMLSNIDFFSGVPESQFENSNFSLLMDLIGSKTNFCNEIFVQSIKQMLDGVSFQINSFKLAENPYETELRNSFEKLNQMQFNKLVVMAQKLSSNKESNKNCNLLMDLIGNKTNLCNQEFLSSTKKMLDELSFYINNFPLPENPFQVVPKNELVQDVSILNKTQLIKSFFGDSQNLNVSQQNGHLVMKNDKGSWRQSYCNFILDIKKSYIFRISISQTTSGGNYIMFGLQPDSAKDQGHLMHEYMSYCENNNSGMQKSVRGGQLHKGDGSPVNRQIEMRICLEKQFLRVSDYPSYSSVCEIDDVNKIKSNIQYRFGIESFGENTTIITEIIETQQFDNKI